MALEWRDRAALVGALLVAALCVRLGVWQLDRLRQRRARNAQVLARRTEPPLSVTGTISAESARDRRLSARGVYDYGATRAFRESISSLRYDSPTARPCWWTGVGLHHPMGTTWTRQRTERGTARMFPESA